MKKVLTKEACFIIAQHCKTRSEFKSASSSAYDKARRNGWIKDYTWFEVKDRKPPKYWSDYEHCKEEAAKYSSISDFQNHNSAAANQAKKHGWLYDFYDYKHMPKGYWNNYERCRDLAAECSSRSEFSKRSSAAYMWSKKNSWIDSFDWLVDERIYNNAKVYCVYAYEFKDNNAVYVGRTLMRRKSKRDSEHRNGKYIDNGGDHICRDSVLAFSIDYKCEIPSMIILEENLTIAEGREREDYWKWDYYSRGWALINKAKTGIHSGALGSLDRGKWTYDTCIQVARGYYSLSEFKRANGSAYEVARINGWLKDYKWFCDTNELISAKIKEVRNKKRLWTRKKCYELALTCRTVSEFQKKSSRAYVASKEYGWFEDYTWFVSGFSLIRPVKWAEDKCREIALTCRTKTEFKKKNSSAYTSARKNGWLKGYDWLVDGNVLAREERRKYTRERCYEIALHYQTLSDYKFAIPSAYAASRVNGWLKDYTWFKNGRFKARKWNDDFIKKEASQYIHERDFMLGSNVAYRKARDNNKLKDFFNSMWFNFNGYYEVSGFELKINSDIQVKDYKYLLFSSNEAQKAIFKFIKEELQQGQGVTVPNMGMKYIEQTGFYELFPKRPSWEKFKKEVCPFVVYSFEINNGRVLLTPMNIKNNNALFKEYSDYILKI